MRIGLLLLPFLLGAQPLPRFEDFPAPTDWHGPNAAPKFTTASERKFRTQLTEAAKLPPDFAGHYRIAGWGCGSACAAGAIIDLQTGTVYPPPRGGTGSGWDRWIFTGGIVEGNYLECRVDSRLVIVRQQAEDPASQELHYLVWENNRFRPLRTVVRKKEQ